METEPQELWMVIEMSVVMDMLLRAKNGEDPDDIVMEMYLAASDYDPDTDTDSDCDE